MISQNEGLLPISLLKLEFKLVRHSPQITLLPVIANAVIVDLDHIIFEFLLRFIAVKHQFVFDYAEIYGPLNMLQVVRIDVGVDRLMEY